MAASSPSLQVHVTISAPGSSKQLVFGLTKPPPEVESSSAFSFDYTGLHDGGSLPPPREGLYRDLAATLSEAKVGVDHHMKILLEDRAKAPQERAIS